MKGHLKIARTAIPVILANATVPLLGLADTAAIGHTGGAADLGAIALGALVFGFVYWGFGFLRMGTTGFVAQAAGARDDVGVRDIALRAGAMGLAIGLALLASQHAIILSALYLLEASDAVKTGVRAYFEVRIWGAPATLTTFSLLGVLIGLGKTRHLLWLQLVLNGVNILLNVVFVLGLGWGVKGIAAGTVIAEYTALLFGIWMVRRVLDGAHPRGGLRRPYAWWFAIGGFRPMLRANGNIMIRTIALLSAFAWFANQGARFGDTVLAANHILLQFVSFSAFFLDGYAHVVEMMVGRAVGSRDLPAFRTQLKQANQLAGVTAIALASLFFFIGTAAIHGLTTDAEVRITALYYLPFACVYIAVSFYAFQLDGVFIGATRSREMRNAGIASLAVFLGSSFFFAHWWGNAGLWLAFIAYVIVRGLSLALYMPRVKALMRAGPY